MKKATLALALTLALGIPGLTGFAGSLSDVVVTGTVTDAATGFPIPEVGITAHDAPFQGVRAVTDAAGRFTISLPDRGWAGQRITLRFQRPGYALAERSIALGADGGTLDVAMHPVPTESEAPVPTPRQAPSEFGMERDRAGFASTAL